MSKKLSFVVLAGLFICVMALQYTQSNVFSNSAVASAGNMAGQVLVKQQDYMQMRRRFAQSLLHSPDELTNMTGGEIRTVMKEPELVRQDGATTVWQYRSDHCVLDIFFTPKRDQQALFSPAQHFEIRAREVDGSDEAVHETCLSELIDKDRHHVRMVNVSAIYKAIGP